ncbi:MAG: DMT family transporter [Rhodobacteraceae bacterium]|nr:MAG: DMT family transporter [Paracoccaceae bacterium]
MHVCTGWRQEMVNETEAINGARDHGMHMALIQAEYGPADPRKGVLLMLLGIGLFSILNGVVKGMTDVFPVVQISFFRNACASIAIIMLMLVSGLRPSHLRSRAAGVHFALAALFTLSLVMVFEAYARMPLADVTAISFAQPLIVIALAAMIGREKPLRAEWVAVAFGLCGVLLMVQPSGNSTATGAMLAFGGAIFSALCMLLQRRLSATDGTHAIAFYTLSISALLLLPLLPAVWVAPTAPQWAGLIAMGLASGLCQYLTVRAFFHAPASTIAPVTYTKMFWALLIGLVWFGDWPGPMVLIGTVIVLAASGIAFRAARQRPIQFP